MKSANDILGREGRRDEFMATPKEERGMEG